MAVQALVSCLRLLGDTMEDFRCTESTPGVFSCGASAVGVCQPARPGMAAAGALSGLGYTLLHKGVCHQLEEDSGTRLRNAGERMGHLVCWWDGLGASQVWPMCRAI